MALSDLTSQLDRPTTRSPIPTILVPTIPVPNRQYQQAVREVRNSIPTIAVQPIAVGQRPKSVLDLIAVGGASLLEYLIRRRDSAAIAIVESQVPVAQPEYIPEYIPEQQFIAADSTVRLTGRRSSNDATPKYNSNQVAEFANQIVKSEQQRRQIQTFFALNSRSTIGLPNQETNLRSSIDQSNNSEITPTGFDPDQSRQINQRSTLPNTGSNFSTRTLTDRSLSNNSEYRLRLRNSQTNLPQATPVATEQTPGPQLTTIVSGTQLPIVPGAQPVYSPQSSVGRTANVHVNYLLETTQTMRAGIQTLVQQLQRIVDFQRNPQNQLLSMYSGAQNAISQQPTNIIQQQMMFTLARAGSTVMMNSVPGLNRQPSYNNNGVQAGSALDFAMIRNLARSGGLAIDPRQVMQGLAIQAINTPELISATTREFLQDQSNSPTIRPQPAPAAQPSLQVNISPMGRQGSLGRGRVGSLGGPRARSQSQPMPSSPSLPPSLNIPPGSVNLPRSQRPVQSPAVMAPASHPRFPGPPASPALGHPTLYSN